MAKLKGVVNAADNLSLGISIVVAILIGIGLGFWINAAFKISWGLWIGVFLGISAAILNIKKAYDKQIKSLDELKDENRYKHLQSSDEDEE
ncbi:hypothetical protein LMG7974_00203 [Campylobacter majalis]|uniref:AtpZ/AtpI family protein n=1 Tax=Campylobacter majalis TaxID=2790656 RepID=A0ABM8Q2P3_9BACT|nr:AtpZ/AtpI family protein [Campylobacter majalis]CAD7287023.1 hypothetical protein LMG7974_00203 [Campylobacter majalis]